MDWLEIKTYLSDLTSLSRDALHIITGLGIHLLLVLVLRSWFGSLLPWFITLLFALGNEWLDLTFEVWVDEIRHRQWEDAASDVALTMLVPSLLLLLSRFAPLRYLRPADEPRSSE
jgi:hypothetical protein